MEHLWPRAALEQEVMPARRLRIRFLAGGAVLLPLLAQGHGCEFLFARLDVEPGGRLTLQMTADYGGNPMLPDEEAAKSALMDALRVRAAGEGRRLDELARLHFEKRGQWDPETPASFAPPEDGTPHRLLTATWSWHADVDALAFEVPRQNVHDVLLWTTHLRASEGDPKWMLLIGGESSPEIALVAAQDGGGWQRAGMIIAACFCLLGLWGAAVRSRKTRRGAQFPAT